MVSLDDLRNEELNKNHKLVEIKVTIDNPNLRLESLYFWLIDYIRDGLGLNLDKISDVFGGSEGSMFFGDMSSRLNRILELIIRLGGLINDIEKSIASLLNELKLLQSRIALFDELRSEDLNISLSAYVRLKQIWESYIDSRTPNSLINLRNNIGYTTVLDLFYIYDIKEYLDKLKEKKFISKALYEHLFPSVVDNNRRDDDKDISLLVEKKIINKKVGDIVRSKLIEFYNWLEITEPEWRSRYNYYKGYLLHQLSSLMLYIDTVRPYIRFSRRLLQKEYNNPDIVTVFETAMLELDLLSYGSENKIKEWDNNKKDGVENSYISVYDISIKARLRPTTVSRSNEYSTMYTFAGRIDIIFRSYILKKEEFDEIRKNEEMKDLAFIKGLEERFFRYEVNELFNIFLGDKIINDENSRKKLKDKFNIEITSYKDLNKFRWTKEMAEELLKDDEELYNTLGWLLKYLPSNNQNNNNQEKKEENKNDNNKKDIENPFSILLEPFVSLYDSIKSSNSKDNIDSLSSMFEPIFKNIIFFGRNEDEMLKPKKKEIDDNSKKEKDNLKKNTTGTIIRIYNSFKSTFGLLS